MPFRCRQCGTCCMHMGAYLVVEQPLGPYRFACSSVSTGTPFLAEIDPDKRALFEDISWIREHPEACTFLRPRGHQIVCTIHRTSPAQCKAYRCVVLRILSHDGAQAGTVTGTLILHSEDRDLRRIWGEGETSFHRTEPGAEERIEEYLVARGYRVE